MGPSLFYCFHWYQFLLHHRSNQGVHRLFGRLLQDSCQPFHHRLDQLLLALWGYSSKWRRRFICFRCRCVHRLIHTGPSPWWNHARLDEPHHRLRLSHRLRFDEFTIGWRRVSWWCRKQTIERVYRHQATSLSPPKDIQKKRDTCFKWELLNRV